MQQTLFAMQAAAPPPRNLLKTRAPAAQFAQNPRHRRATAALRLPKLSRNDKARAFRGALGDAAAIVFGIHGGRWSFSTDLAVLVRIPAALASYTHDKGGTVRINTERGWRVPAPRFWPSGALWPGLEAIPEGPRETRPLMTDQERAIYVKAYRRLRGEANDFADAFGPAAEAARRGAFAAVEATRKPPRRVAADFPKLAAAMAEIEEMV
jgi:hypothetical protein